MSRPHQSHDYTYIVRPATSSNIPHLPKVESSAATLFTSVPGLEYIADDPPMSVDAHQAVLEKWRNGPFGKHLDRHGQEYGTWVAVASRVGIEKDAGEIRNEEEVVGFIVTEVLPVTCIEGANDKDTGTAEGGHKGSDEVQAYFIHINELSIAMNHQRRGLAGRLINTAKDFARSLNAPNSLNTDSGQDNASDTTSVLGLSLTTFRDLPFNAPFYEKFGFRGIDRDRVEDVVGLEGERIWREDRERFEGDGERGVRGGRKRCWMVCDL